MSKTYRFPCGCSFPLKENNTISFDIENIPENCSAVFDMLSKGLTLGVFQFETSTGKTWCQKLKPRNIEDLCALASIVRPGTLNAKDEKGISLAEHYCRRRNGEEEVIPIHPLLAKVLEKRYGVIVYQEDSINIVKEIADFSASEAERWRKSVGKKLADVVEEMHKLFIEKIKQSGKIPVEEAERIFALLKAGERYSFCRAHSWRYGAVLAYQTAYIKCHFPMHFYASKLKNIKLKKSQKKEKDENSVADFVNDAKLFNIETQLPDLRDLEAEFYTRNKIIKVGITNIKGVGDSIFAKIIDGIKVAEATWQKPLKDFSYYEFLTGCVLPYLGYSITEKLIKSGSLDWMGLSRREMLYQLDMLKDLTTTEIEGLLPRIRDFKHLDELLLACAAMTKDGGICSRNKKVELLKDKVRLLKNPEVSLVDQPLQKSWDEENLLGIAISSCEMDSCDVTMCNSSCKEIVAGRDDEVILPGQVMRMSTRIISKGQNQGKEMATLFINDGTCELECLVFAEAYEKYKNVLFDKGCFVFRGQRNKKGSNFVVRDVWLAKSN